MIHVRFVFFSFAFIVYMLVGAASQERLTVSIYYECLCPDSINFVVKELYPAYKKLQNSLIVDFVPFGHANAEMINGHWYFRCQHGQQECFGNKIQACALAQNVSQSRHVGFINCVMSNNNPASQIKAKECAYNMGLNWTSINECLTNGLGDELLVQYGNRTVSVKPKIRYVPTIIFNNNFNQTLQDDAEVDFFPTACKLFQTPPKVCGNKKYIYN